MISQLAIAKEEQMGALLATVGRLTQVMNRCRILEILYTPKTVDNTILKNLHKALIDLYVAVLRSALHCHELFSASTAKRTIQAILLPARVGGTLDELTRVEYSVTKETRICGEHRNARANAGLL